MCITLASAQKQEAMRIPARNQETLDALLDMNNYKSCFETSNVLVN